MSPQSLTSTIAEDHYDTAHVNIKRRPRPRHRRSSWDHRLGRCAPSSVILPGLAWPDAAGGEPVGGAPC